MSRPASDPPGDFWSRRRAAVTEEQRAADVAAEQERAAESKAALEEKSDAEILDELGLKDPDTLAQGDDFSAFLKSEVPDRLRRRALRRLWRSNPVLANLDALVDYGEDFTDAATVIDNLQTTYRVGKGMLAHIEKQLEAAQGSEEADEPETPEPEAEAEAEAEERDLAFAGEARVSEAPAPRPMPESPQINQQVQSERDALPQDDALPSPRRMRFVYSRTQKGEQ